MRSLYILATLYLGLVRISAQDIEVKKFEPLEKDQTAALSPRKDINGVTCGLVKVQINEDGVEFEGNIIGDVVNHSSEYWVYLSKGTKRLNLKHPNYIPVTIVLGDYGVARIESNRTYSLVLKANHKKNTVSNKMGKVLLKVQPPNADLSIDGTVVPNQSDGVYLIELPQGNHYCSVKIGNSDIYNKQFVVGKKLTEVKIDLTVYFASVYVECKDNDEEIYVNNVYKGKGSWAGNISSGITNFEIKKEGCHPVLRTIEILENEEVKLDIKEFEKISGKMKLSFTPDSCDIYVDDVKIGNTSERIWEVPIGHHILRVEKDYYKPYTKSVTIEENQELAITGNLEFKNYFSEIWINAHNGDANMQYKLAQCYEGRSREVHVYAIIDGWLGWDESRKDMAKAFYWYKSAAELGHKEAQAMLAWCYGGRGVERNDKQAVFWATKSASQNSSYGCYQLGFHYAYGYGIEKDHDKAVYWLKKAILIDDGMTPAKNLLKKLGY